MAEGRLLLRHLLAWPSFFIWVVYPAAAAAAAVGFMLIEEWALGSSPSQVLWETRQLRRDPSGRGLSALLRASELTPHPQRLLGK